jgi:hypothetical protein
MPKPVAVPTDTSNMKISDLAHGPTEMNVRPASHVEGLLPAEVSRTSALFNLNPHSQLAPAPTAIAPPRLSSEPAIRTPNGPTAKPLLPSVRSEWDQPR